jgi:uncharacterized NAD(P)/FAD-binding protein YdhS
VVWSRDLSGSEAFGCFQADIQVSLLDNLVNGKKMCKSLRKTTSDSSGIATSFGPKAASIAIVGGGASGVTVAVNLMRNATMPLSIRVLEPRGGLGLGVAYSAAFDSHLLNVPAGDMSVFHEVPAHFLKWLRGNGHPQAEPTSFVPRRSYGAYLQSVLADALFQARPELTFEHIRTRATRISKNHGTFTIETDSGEAIAASTVVLALGNLPSTNPLPPGSPDPAAGWSPDAVKGLPRSATVLLIGSGLTGVDVCLSLRELGHRGRIYVVSRRGLLPRVHATNASRTPWDGEEVLDVPLNSLFSKVRRAAQQDTEAGGTWHGRIDGLRPHTQDIWQLLTLKEKRRFLRLLRPYWDLHRHRIAPEVNAAVEALQRSGQLEAIGGRIISASSLADGAIRATVELRSGGRRDLVAERAINCTGPELDARRFRVPVLKRLVADGFARYDPLFLGIDATTEGALVARSGAVQDGLYALGPLLRGVFWESTAMPEIRVQAAGIASDILARSVRHAGFGLPQDYAAAGGN